MRTVPAISKMLGFDLVTKKIIQNEEDRIAVMQDQYLLEVFKASGGVRFIDRSRWMVDDQKSKISYKDDEAIEIATSYIKKRKLAKSDEFKLLKVTHLYVGSADEKLKNVEERAIDTGVLFQRMVNGVPVLGPGGKMMVFLDVNGEFTGLEKIWRPIIEVNREVEGIQKPEFAENKLARFLKNCNVMKADVEDMEFGYFEQDWGDRQKILQPAYVFKLRLPFNKGEGFMKSAFVVEAATNPVGTLIRYKRKTEEQPPRV
ncbi:MAG: hypothetical protein PHW11_08960 [Anaerolineaceae bacterium]|nr:hypothetical protein [Anaerolineaceae bacterium]MDD4043697.1 hypothetical protein [Anaerolineaceae bacterium]MDD4577705.1 hypothetical protein [Anaerolineaceae bacterium]